MFFIVTRLLLYLSQILALLFGIKNSANIKNGSQSLFLPFMFYTIIHEIISIMLAYYSKIGNNFFNNIYIVISFMVYFYWFSKILPKKKKYILVALVVFFISVFFSIFKYTFFTELWLLPFCVGALSILVFVTFLFSDLLKSKQIMYYLKMQKFWFSSGLIVFYLGYLPIIIFQKEIAAHSILYILILTILNIILYGCFAKGFTCKIKN